MKTTPEYAFFRILDFWQPVNKIMPLSAFLTAIPTPQSRLFSFLYTKTRKEYIHFPRRKNGKNAFIHPLNIVLYLQKANIMDYLTFSAGLIHDLIEEKVDLFKKEENTADIKVLEQYERQVIRELQEGLLAEASQNRIPEDDIRAIMELAIVLTNHKRHDYYHYITEIFTHPDKAIRERAIQVKLADRTHNVLSLNEFTDEQKLYQCFKNIFILNSAKEHLLEQHEFVGLGSRQKWSSTERLFNKCCKATYDAFVNICYQNLQKGIRKTVPILELAFHRYTFQTKGLWEVTKWDPQEMHPMKLYSEIVRKYDCRLHHQWKEYEKHAEREKEYCHKFFQDFHYSEKQLQALLNYKDAFALTEVLVRLLYQKEYVLGKFSSSGLFTV
ncbi:hypothetical protein HYX14_05765 [Candidatus Woesearchaeota archaeon]|nr:hypothetical protein [Candidatus Woesearchaeota archaeon]